MAERKLLDVCANCGRIYALHYGENCERSGSSQWADKLPAVDVEKELYEALKAVLVMWNSKQPRKLDEMLTWRANDEKAQAMADAAIKAYEAKGRL